MLQKKQMQFLHEKVSSGKNSKNKKRQSKSSSIKACRNESASINDIK